MKNYLGLAILGVFFVIGCTQTITAEMLPLAESLQPQTAREMEDFRHARMTFIAHCSGCHFHMYPSEYRPRQWKLTMREHSANTNLSKGDYENLRRYILRASELAHTK